MTHLLLSPTGVRRLFGLAVVLGGLALAGFTVVGRPLVGVGAYGLAMIATAVSLLRTDSPVFDERDETTSKEAASRTLTVFGLASAVVFPALTVAWGLDLFEWQPWSSAIALFVAVLFLTYGAFVVVIGQRR
ncbi:DUF2178 domain-containing protein [Halobellus ruber]|uniref:DUF2178 domain-containing protein n=1 Tax=Halobellus ruber TaxID=2761102 RepID=UPI001626E483|nr:DUF2178 domain-containing protein [Halobellus ruber]